MKKVTVSAVAGNIAQLKVDALITAINSDGEWFGNIDHVIEKVAGGGFHLQAEEKMPLAHEETMVARGDRCVYHRGKFKNVIFVVDDWKGSLRHIIFVGLCAATEAGFGAVSLPMIRMGVMLGEVEKTPQEAVDEMALGVKMYMEKYPDGSINEITFVVFNDDAVKHLLEEALSDIVDI